jgi:hypothetical protein
VSIPSSSFNHGLLAPGVVILLLMTAFVFVAWVVYAHRQSN